MRMLSLEVVRSSLEPCIQSILDRLQRTEAGKGLQRVLQQRSRALILARPEMQNLLYVLTAQAEESTRGLTARELEVAIRAASSNGAGLQGVAADLQIEGSTVNNHLQHAYGKLGIRSVRQLRLHELTQLANEQARPCEAVDTQPAVEAVRERLESFLRQILRRLSAEWGNRDLSRLFLGKTSPVVLSEICSGGIQYLLRSVVLPTLDLLTAQERSITPFLACGLPKATVAEALELSVCTVRAHAQKIFQKYGVHTWEDLAARLMAEYLPVPMPKAPRGKSSRT